MIISNLPIDLGRVKQNYSTDNENRPLLMSGVAGVSSTSDRGSNESVINNSIYANPSTGTIHANISGNVTGSSGSCTGNAATATQFSANKAVTLTGDVTGTASSKAGWSVATTLANSGVTAGTYGPSADVTGNNNATISVPEITVDAKGRVTSVTNRTLTCKNNTYTVNNATLTIQKNGTTVKTFTANSNTDVTANISVPTKVSELSNDSGFLTSHQSLSNYSTLANTVKSLSISGKTITVTPGSGSAYTLTTQDTVYTHPTTAGNKHIPSGGSANQYLKYSESGTAVWANLPTIPAKTSQLTNDSGYITSSGSCNYANYSGYVQGNKSTGLYVESVKYGNALVTTNQSGFGAIFNAPTKNYRIGCATYPNNDDTLLFYSVTNANVSSSTNTVAKMMTWNGGTGILTATGFSGPLTGNVTGNCSGSSGSCTGNAASATKLQTARSINGANFDGSGNITTANWGTARNISIQDHNAGHTGSAVSVNGSGNVTLKLPSTIHADIDFPITEAEIEAIFNGNS